jgi:REP element-mobilizing transposase RayT
MAFGCQTIRAALGRTTSPRGTCSAMVRRPGQEPRSVAYESHDHAARLEAKQALRFPPVELIGYQALTAAQGFAWAAEEAGYVIHACAVLPEHIHLVIGRHPRRIRQIIGHVKARATRLLHLRDQWHTDQRPVWGEHGWNVFLNDADSVEYAIQYVKDNPTKEGKRLQQWSFVTAFNASVALVTSRGPSASQANAAKQSKDS